MADETHVDIGNATNQVSTAQKCKWASEMDKKLSEMKSTEKLERTISICKVPANIGKNCGYHDYTPSLVSFGPYYYGHESCKRTEDVKEQVFLYFLKGSNKISNDYVGALSKEVEELRGAYNELDSHWQKDTEAFLKLMIFDGCFLLEILRTAKNSNYVNIRDIGGIDRREIMEYYRHDMLLLENQIPMLVLEKLLSVQNNLSIPDAQKELYELILRFVAPSSPDNIVEKLLNQDKKRMYLHVLDLCRSSLLYDQGPRRTSFEEILFRPLEFFFPEGDDLKGHVIRIMCLPVLVLYLLICLGVMLLSLIIYTIIVLPLRNIFVSKPDSNICFIIPSATELDKVGIRFEMNNTKSLSCISFGGRTLRLPQIYIDGAAQSRFLNIIAFEQLHAPGENEITSYIYFMSRLLQVAGDVRLLQLRGIIHTTLHKHHVVELFRNLTKDMVHDPNIFLVEQYNQVANDLTKNFYIKMNNAWQRDLWQTYLKSPWAVISVVAALFIFTLTSVQTAYTVLSYYSPK